MNNKFEKWMNDQFAPWVIRMVFASNFLVILLILGDLAFGR